MDLQVQTTTTSKHRFFSFLVALVTATAATSAYGEERKFTVMLAVPTKSVEDLSGLELPNPDDIWDEYFDTVKNAGEDQVNSFAEYWYEISHGNVSVSGDVFGWVEIPWPVGPEGIEPGEGARLPFTDLNGNGILDLFGGELVPASQFQKILIDYNGDSDDTEGTGIPPFTWLDLPTPGLVDFHPEIGPVWTPGERFLDLNNNERYDAFLEYVWDGYGEEGCLLDFVIDPEEVVDYLWFGGDGDGKWDFPEPFEDFLVIFNPYAG